MLPSLEPNDLKCRMNLECTFSHTGFCPYLVPILSRDPFPVEDAVLDCDDPRTSEQNLTLLRPVIIYMVHVDGAHGRDLL